MKNSFQGRVPNLSSLQRVNTFGTFPLPPRRMVQRIATIFEPPMTIHGPNNHDGIADLGLSLLLKTPDLVPSASSIVTTTSLRISQRKSTPQQDGHVQPSLVCQKKSLAHRQVCHDYRRVLTSQTPASVDGSTALLLRVIPIGGGQTVQPRRKVLHVCGSVRLRWDKRSREKRGGALYSRSEAGTEKRRADGEVKVEGARW